MIREYLAAAMERARYEILEDDGSYYGEIPCFQGVYSNAPQLEECRNMLDEVLEEWLLLSLSMGFSVPAVDGIDLKIKKVDRGTKPASGPVSGGKPTGVLSRPGRNTPSGRWSVASGVALPEGVLGGRTYPGGVPCPDTRGYRHGDGCLFGRGLAHSQRSGCFRYPTFAHYGPRSSR